MHLRKIYHSTSIQNICQFVVCGHTSQISAVLMLVGAQWSRLHSSLPEVYGHSAGVNTYLIPFIGKPGGSCVKKSVASAAGALQLLMNTLSTSRCRQELLNGRRDENFIIEAPWCNRVRTLLFQVCHFSKASSIFDGLGECCAFSRRPSLFMPQVDFNYPRQLSWLQGPLHLNMWFIRDSPAPKLMEMIRKWHFVNMIYIIHVPSWY